MNFDFHDHETVSQMSDAHEELYALEERYLERFGRYPDMPELSQETLGYYVARIRQSLESGKRVEELSPYQRGER